MNAYILCHYLTIFKRVTLFITLLSFSAEAGWVPYKVQGNDQLGKMIQDLGLKQWLWGESGLVQKIYLKNKNIINSPDYIFIDQVIYLPESLDDLKDEILTTDLNLSIRKESKTQNEEINKNMKGSTPDQKRKALLRVGTIFSLMDRSLTDKTTKAAGTAKSKAIYGLQVTSRMPISKFWNIDSSLTYRKVSFVSSSTRTFSVESESFLRLSLGASKVFTNFNLGGGISYEQIPIITGVSSTSIGISSFNVVSPYLMGDWSFYSWGRTNLGLEFMASYNLSSSKESFDLESGFDTSIALDLKRELTKNLSYSIAPFIQYGTKDTNTVEHSDLDIGTKLLLNWVH
jgi:hypothetical protein